MASEEGSELRQWIFVSQSFFLFLAVWIRFLIRNRGPDPQSYGLWIQFGFGSRTLVKMATCSELWWRVEAAPDSSTRWAAIVCDCCYGWAQGCGSAFIFGGSRSSWVLFNAEPDPAAFSRQIRIQLNKLCRKLPYESLLYCSRKNEKLLKRTKKTWS